MKKKLLVVYTSMIIGGATASLLTFLASLDKCKYDIDLLLHNNSGVRQNEIPPGINVLSEADIKKPAPLRFFERAIRPSFAAAAFRALWYKKVKRRPLAAVQLMSERGAAFGRRLGKEKEYDAAISYLEFWPLYYTARYVKAKRKIAWIHLDYLESGLEPRFDRKAFTEVDRIVFVSEKCVESFRLACPEYAAKAVCVENLVSPDSVRRAAAENAVLPGPDGGHLKLISVCRVKFSHKGLDRGVEAFARLKKEGALGDTVWYIVGDGEDMPQLKAMIKGNGLEEHIFPLGAKLNPLPYEAACDIFFLPSRYEGKPIAVTEALILGLPVLVTEYSSAREQTTDGAEGLILENSGEGVYRGLLRLLTDRTLIPKLKAGAAVKRFDSEEEIRKIHALIDGDI